MEGKTGWEALKSCLQYGIAVLAEYPSGATVAKDDDYWKSFTNDINFVEQEWWIKEKFRRYRFLPRQAGLLCLDIDCKGGKDGVGELLNFCKKQEESLEIFKDFPDNFPCYVRTINDGYHLYFKSPQIPDGFEVATRLPNAQGIEVKFAHTLTSAGSCKNDKHYVLFGNIAKAPPLPAFIKDELVIPTRKPIATSGVSPTFKGKPSWKNITKWTDEAHPNMAGRNERAFRLACVARRHKYTFEETLSALESDTSVNSLGYKELLGVVKSVYKFKKKEEQKMEENSNNFDNIYNIDNRDQFIDRINNLASTDAKTVTDNIPKILEFVKKKDWYSVELRENLEKIKKDFHDALEAQRTAQETQETAGVVEVSQATETAAETQGNQASIAAESPDVIKSLEILKEAKKSSQEEIEKAFKNVQNLLVPTARKAQAEADLKAAQSLADKAEKEIEKMEDLPPEKRLETIKSIRKMYESIVKARARKGQLCTLKNFHEDLDSSDPLNAFRPNLFCKKLSFPEGTMSVVGARTGRGKTTALVNLAIDAIDNGRKCLFINLETPNVQLFYKLILLRAYKNAPGHVKADTFDKIENPTTELCKVRKNQNNASNEKFLVNYDFESYARNAIDYVGDYVGSGQLMFPKDIGLSQQDIIELISRQEKGSVILIDYLQRVPSDEKSADGYLKVKQISNAILQASLESEVVTICGAQFNRTSGTDANGDDNFDDASFRESADIEQDAHIAIGIGRKKDRKSRFVEILKSRQAAVTGNRHEMECNLAYSYMKMTEKVINIDQRKFKLHDEKGRFMKNPAETTVETQQLAD